MRGGEVLDDLTAVEGRSLAGQSVGADQLADGLADLQPVEVAELAAIERVGQLVGSESVLLGERPPLAALLGEVEGLLALARRQRRDLGLSGTRPAGSFEGVEDLLAALRQRERERPGNAGDLGGALVSVGPLDAELAGQPLAQLGLENVARGHPVLVEVARVEGPPAVLDTLGGVAGVGHVRNEEVDVNVRVALA